LASHKKIGKTIEWNLVLWYISKNAQKRWKLENKGKWKVEVKEGRKQREKVAIQNLRRE
jgi:hypothetical protein